MFAAVALALLCSAGSGAGVAAPVIVIDPGHDLHPNLRTEPIGPGSSQRKVLDGGGARGEAAVNLAISRRLAELLRNAGVQVVLTRTRTDGVSMSNIARARIANRARASLFLRVHADGSEDPGQRGTAVLHPALRRGWTDDIYAPSLRAARIVQAELVRALQSRDRGLQEHADMTGFNWADVPAILVEVGFLTSPDERRLLLSPVYQQRAALGLCRGALLFLGRAAGKCGR